MSTDFLQLYDKFRSLLERRIFKDALLFEDSSQALLTLSNLKVFVAEHYPGGVQDSTLTDFDIPANDLPVFVNAVWDLVLEGLLVPAPQLKRVAYHTTDKESDLYRFFWVTPKCIQKYRRIRQLP